MYFSHTEKKKWSDYINKTSMVKFWVKLSKILKSLDILLKCLIDLIIRIWLVFSN